MKRETRFVRIRTPYFLNKVVCNLKYKGQTMPMLAKPRRGQSPGSRTNLWGTEEPSIAKEK